ncbi:hypothetical protein Bbelb_263150 [Branchiostoma belcheri]|nr:hypothetical protein Bbelb_263150 [Branchiostoma belcheri]
MSVHCDVSGNMCVCGVQDQGKVAVMFVVWMVFSTRDRCLAPGTAASREQCDNPGLLYDEFLADLRPIRPGEKPPPYSLYPPEYHGDPTTIPSSQLTSGQNNRGQLQQT